MGEMDSVHPKLQDLEDLEDRLSVMESLVTELKVNNISTAQLKIVLAN